MRIVGEAIDAAQYRLGILEYLQGMEDVEDVEDVERMLRAREAGSEETSRHDEEARMNRRPRRDAAS